MPDRLVGSPRVTATSPEGGCYGIQVLVAGRRKQWREEVCGQMRRAGFQATGCDSGIDALTVLVLGLPVDVLVTDVELEGDLCCSRLAVEARALRPGLRIVLASDLSEDEVDDVRDLHADTILMTRDLRNGSVVSTVRGMLANRAA